MTPANPIVSRNSYWASAFLAGACLAGGLATTSASAADEASSAVIAKGKYLATAGDCIACHTAADGKTLAGGKAIETPYGSIYTPNITPDKETGIGNWSDDDFYRSFHEGINKQGENLYPVFPFPWYTRVTRDDVMAIKAYLFSLEPVHAERLKNQLAFPFNVRAGLTAWRALYFTPGTFKPEPSKSEQINRGAYLVEGLGHCGECHTQHNAMGASEKGRTLAGGVVQGWYAPNITADVQEGVGGWSEDELAQYLKTGSAPGKGIAVGPMAETVHDSLRLLTDDDVKAMAAYLKSTPAKAEASTAHAPPTGQEATLYLNNCAFCHQVDGRGIQGAGPPLAGNGAVTAQGGQNVIRLVIGGYPATDQYGPMPALGADLTDEQIAAVANYVRTAWSNKGTANVTPSQVGDLKSQTAIPLGGGKDACGSVPGDIGKVIDNQDNGINAALQSVDATNMLDRAGDIAKRFHGADPQAPLPEAVNGLTAAYCHILDTASTPSMPEKRSQLHTFGSFMYGRLAAVSKPEQHAN